MKLTSHSLSPHVFPLNLQASKDLQHIFFSCLYAKKCCDLFGCFHTNWVFDYRFKENMVQLISCPIHKKKPRLIWLNAVKAILSKIWFERNQRTFQNKASSWTIQIEMARSMLLTGALFQKTSKISPYKIQVFF